MKIHSIMYASPPSAQFSILIPTWNNLPYLRLCIESLVKNSSNHHQIIVHANEGTDGTLDWLRSRGISHTWSKSNVGVCHALNAASELAQTDHIAFFNDDMYALPGWDAALLSEIAAIPHRLWFLSSTMIEPVFTGNPCVLAPHDFGQSAQVFDENRLLEQYQQLETQDWCGATWPPNVVPKELWLAVSGYSTEFSPGLSSDPDFSMKLWIAGVRYFKGVAASRVYHFQKKSTGKVKKNPGPAQFLKKWGITQGAFGKYYLRRGTPWVGALPNPGPPLPLMMAKLKSRLKTYLV